MDATTQAKNLGWVPKEDFKGDPARWVDAETFVQRGEEIMPLLKANNQRLQSELEGMRGQLSEAQVAIRESQESMQALVQHQSEATLQAVKETKARLRAQIRKAREDSNWESLDELEEHMDEVRVTERTLEEQATKKPEPKKPEQPQPKVDPAFVQWQAENSWWGTDKRRTAQTVLEAQLLRSDPANNGLIGRAFYEEAARQADELLNPKGRATSKVDDSTGSGTGSGSGSSSGGKGFAALPAEAKAACDKQEKMLVGPNKAFKDQAAWRKHYAEQFFLYE